jgi:hypothetical protein
MVARQALWAAKELRVLVEACLAGPVPQTRQEMSREVQGRIRKDPQRSILVAAVRGRTRGMVGSFVTLACPSFSFVRKVISFGPRWRCAGLLAKRDRLLGCLLSVPIRGQIRANPCHPILSENPNRTNAAA